MTTCDKVKNIFIFCKHSNKFPLSILEMHDNAKKFEKCFNVTTPNVLINSINNYDKLNHLTCVSPVCSLVTVIRESSDQMDFKCLFCLAMLREGDLVCTADCEHKIHEWCLDPMKRLLKC